VKRREAKGKEKKERYTHLNASSSPAFLMMYSAYKLN